MINNRILTDIDGVLLTWQSKFEEFIKEEGAVVKIGNFKMDDSYMIKDCFALQSGEKLTDEQALRLVKAYNNSEYFEDLDPIHDAKLFLPTFMGFEIIAISACGVGSLIKQHRERNLAKHFDNIKEVLTVGVSKSKKVHLEKFTPSFYVEDSLEQAILGDSLGHKTFLITKPKNAGSLGNSNVMRVSGWKQIYEHIMTELNPA